MEAAQRHFRPAASHGAKAAWLSKLTPSRFVAAVVSAGKDSDWACATAGRGGSAFFLASDKLRRARLVFERDRRNMGPDGWAAPVVLLGADEHSLDELAADDLIAWTLHLRGRRNSNEGDIAFIRALFSVLRL